MESSGRLKKYAIFPDSTSNRLIPPPEVPTQSRFWLSKSTDATSFTGRTGEDLIEYAVQGKATTTALPDGNMMLSLNLNPFADDILVQLEISNDLKVWRHAEDTFVRFPFGPATHGFAPVPFKTLVPPASAKNFVRYRIELR